MRVLVAFECSGVVREAFRALGHDAWSCDLKPSETKTDFHIQGDVFAAIKNGWDLMIAHPPCTYLSNVGNRHFKTDASRFKKRESAAEFFMQIYNAPIIQIAVENPT